MEGSRKNPLARCADVAKPQGEGKAHSSGGGLKGGRFLTVRGKKTQRFCAAQENTKMKQTNFKRDRDTKMEHKHTPGRKPGWNTIKNKGGNKN